MSTVRLAAGGLLVVSLGAGTLSDEARPSVAREWNGYHVLVSDFHVHHHPFGWAVLSPWDTVIEAGRQGLDVIAMTPHNQVWTGKTARWFSQAIGGPMVIVGEEITTPRYHLIAVGIADAIPANLPVGRAIDEVHTQGGVAIAAHSYEVYWPTYDADALEKLDGAEVVRPESQYVDNMAVQLREFFGRAQLTAVGASDYHGLGTVGYSRTYVFARSRTEQGVLDAIRDGRTVVYDRARAFGDPAMIAIAAEHGGLPREVPELPVPGAVRVFSRIAALLALTIALLFNRW